MTGTVEKRAVLAAFDDEEQLVDEHAGVALIEHPFQGYLNLRLDPANDVLGGAVANVLGVALPAVPNRTAQGDGVVVYWLGPDEWLLRTPSEDDMTVFGALSGALGDHWHALTDISGGMTHIAVGGEAAAAVLAQGVTIDLHPKVFPAGHCAQTVMARSNVLIAPTGDAGNAFDVFVRRSFADHVLTFLRDAAHDVGYRFSRKAL